MTKELARTLAQALTEMLRDRPVIFVQAVEWESFVPKCVFASSSGVSQIQLVSRGKNSTLLIVLEGVKYKNLDNPVIRNQTIVFTVKCTNGQKIYTSFSLLKTPSAPYCAHWLALKNDVLFSQ